MTAVAVGQTWSILFQGSHFVQGRAVVRIDRLEGDRAYGAVVATGRAVHVSVRALERGQRGSYLVADVDAVPIHRAGARGPRSNRVTPRARAAVAMLDRRSRQAVAIAYGVSESAVRNWQRLVKLEKESCNRDS